MASNKNRKRPAAQGQKLEITGIVLQTTTGNIQLDMKKVLVIDKKTRKPLFTPQGGI